MSFKLTTEEREEFLKFFTEGERLVHFKRNVQPRLAIEWAEELVERKLKETLERMNEELYTQFAHGSPAEYMNIARLKDIEIIKSNFLTIKP